MSDKSTSSAENAPTGAESPPKTRRISNKNPKKSAKPAKPKKPVEQEVPIEEFDSAPPAGDTPGGENLDSATDAKRKNRRRRGKEKSSQKDGESLGESASPPVLEETTHLGEVGNDEIDHQSGTRSKNSRDTNDSDHRKNNQNGRKEPQSQRPSQKQRSRPDPDKIAKNAWKIFLAEVSEEGVALIGDNDARELARRCFRLAEIFLEEEGRRN